MTAADLIPQLEAKWKAAARAMGPDWGVGYIFTRPKPAAEGEVVEPAKEREQGVALCEIIQTAQPWAKLAYDGIMVQPAAWKAARDMSGLTGLPLMVVVVAADGARFLKVTDFGPAYAETKRLAVPDFRPV